MKNIIRAMFWKELKLFFKMTIPMVFLYYAAMLGGIYYLLEKMNEYYILVDSTVNTYMFIFIVAVMVMIGGQMAAFSTSEDNKEGTLNTLLASVRKPSQVWVGQFLFFSIVSFALGVLGSIGIFIALKIRLMYTMEVHLSNILLWYVLAPVIGMLYNAINLFLLWVIRHQMFLFIPTLVLPCAIAFLIMKYQDKIATFNINLSIAIVMGLICLALILALIKLINVIPKKNYVSKI